MKPLSYRAVIKKARKAKFVFRRSTGGTHEIWWNELEKKTCVIPHHKEIKPGTLKSIIKQMGFNRARIRKIMILHINTKEQTKISVALKENGKIVKKLSAQNKFGSQVLLPLIMKLLQPKTYNLQTLKAIEVETGPGSFTGLRVGVAVANALGFALNIPVNNKKIESQLRYE